MATVDDNLKAELQRVLAAKQTRRIRLAEQPITEKIHALVELQRLAAPLLQARGRAVRPWDISEG